MQGTTTPPQAQEAEESPSTTVLLPALSRLGLPALLFGVVFLVLVTGLTVLMTPDRFPVHVGNKSVRLSSLEAEQQSLLLQQSDLQKQRDSLDANTRAPILHQVAVLRSSVVPFGRVLLRVEDIRSGFATPSMDPISLPGVEVNDENDTITLGGEVRDPGGRSMQMLASFIDGLRSISLLSSVSEPEYTALPLGVGGTVSPFMITLTLAHE